VAAADANLPAVSDAWCCWCTSVLQLLGLKQR
jgi:hypothetical protein